MGVLALGIAASACDRAGASATALVPATTSATTSTQASDTRRDTPADATGLAAAERTHAAPGAVRELTLPTGTRLSIVLDTGVGSDSSRVEEAVQGHLTRPVVLHGQTVLAEGSRVSGVVTDATRSGKVKGLAHVGMRFNTLTRGGDEERYRIHTADVRRTAAATKKKDALEIGAPAAGGAVVGALLGGKKGAAIGATAGGGAGAAVVLSTRGKEVHLARGTPLTLRLSKPVTIRIKG